MEKQAFTLEAITAIALDVSNAQPLSSTFLLPWRNIHLDTVYNDKETGCQGQYRYSVGLDLW